MDDFSSLIWFCYRKDFPPIEPTKITTDIGWGCMLRAAQMLIAHACLRHLLGRDWRKTETENLNPYSTYRQVLRWFSDSPVSTCPFSIHNLVYRSKIIDIKNGVTDTLDKTGEWFSPSRVCQIAKHLVRQQNSVELTVYVANDGIVYMDKIYSVAYCTNQGNSESPPPYSPVDDTETLSWKPIIILIPIRLGVDSVNKLYIPSLKALLRMPQCLGIIGGRPRQSLYFVGYQDDDVIFLDPHIVKPSVKQDQQFSAESYHCTTPQKFPFSSIDPSLALGFFCQDKNQFQNFCDEVNKWCSLVETPIFTIESKSPKYGQSPNSIQRVDSVVL